MCSRKSAEQLTDLRENLLDLSCQRICTQNSEAFQDRNWCNLSWKGCYGNSHHHTFFRISKAVNRAVTLELLLKSTAQLRGSAVEPMGRKARQLRPRKGADEPIIESKKRDDQKAMDGARLLQLVLAGQTAAVEAMLQRKVDANSTDERGWPPLFHASQRGQPSMVKLLLAHKALATFAGMTGETALMVASEQGQTKIANMLLAASCSVNLAANDGTTALMGACLHSRIDMVRLLLEKKASVGASTIQGGTALAVACHGDKVLSAEIVKLFIAFMPRNCWCTWPICPNAFDRCLSERTFWSSRSTFGSQGKHQPWDYAWAVSPHHCCHGQRKGHCKSVS